LLSVISFFLHQYNLTRLFFGVWVYTVPYAFFFIPIIAISLQKESLLLNIFVILGVIISAGLIFDHFTGIFTILKISGGEEFQEAKGELMRASFLFDSPTAFVNYFNFCYLCVIIKYELNINNKIKYFYFFLLIFMFFAIFFTGSRQILLTTGFLFLYAFISRIKVLFKSVINILAFIILLMCFLFISKIYFWDDNILTNRILDEQLDEDVRVAYWTEGINLFSITNVKYWFFGHGFTSTMGQKEVGDEFLYHHFESAFFAGFYEIGIFSFLFFLLPFIYLVHKLYVFKKQLFDYRNYINLVIVYVFCSFFIYMITPGGVHFTSLMSMGLVCGLFINTSIKNHLA
jgi:hypothetical protein